MCKQSDSTEIHREPPPVRLGISSCLLGEKVRYDGGHKLDSYLLETLGPHVDWVPVCPEVEAGLGVPREPMRLVGMGKKTRMAEASGETDLMGEPGGVRLVTRQTRIDHTGLLLGWSRSRIPELARINLCGFVFKSRSPSCGMHVEIVDKDGLSSQAGTGIWASAFVEACPLLPVEEESRLHDAGVCKDFIERVFAFHRSLQNHV